MKRTIGLTAALLVGCATGAVVRELIVPARAQGQTGPNYEYQVVEVPDHWGDGPGQAQNIVNRFGREGWRVASTMVAPNGLARYVLERPTPVR